MSSENKTAELPQVVGPNPVVGSAGNPRLVSTPLISSSTAGDQYSTPPPPNDIWKRRLSPPNSLADVVITFRGAGAERELNPRDPSRERLTQSESERRPKVNRLHKRRLIETLIAWIKNIPPIRRIIRQIDIEDRAKRADYLSSKFLTATQIIPPNFQGLCSHCCFCSSI